MLSVVESIGTRFPHRTHVNTSPKTVACPNCGKPVPWVPESKWRPFCNERCRLIDLGEWFGEGHCLSEPIEDGYAPPTREEDEGYL